VKVTDVPLEEALTNILAAHDYTYIATESMIRVVPLPEITVTIEQPITKIYRITYADANEVAEALVNFVSRQGKVALNKGTSHIMVTDIESKIKAIDKFIEQIDHLTAQVLVEVRIYDITSKEGFELCPKWHAGRNAPYTADTFILPDEVTVTGIGRSDSWQERTSTIVGIERGDPDDYTEMMTEHTWTDPTGEIEATYINPPAMITNRRRKPFVGGSFNRITGGTLRFSVLNDAVDIDLALIILQKQVEVKLLANPRVLVLDNETANFEIIREVPYRELLQVAREDPITYTAFKKVGVNLKVTPHIARDGMIRLHLMSEFGVLVSQNAVSVLTTKDDFGRDVHQNALGVPTVDTRRADTVAMIKDGQTIVIGGLRKRETSRDITKVPLLGDLPLVGGLFQSETESVEVNELVVFITTTIITEPELSGLEKKQFSETKFAGPEMTYLRLEREGRPKTEGGEVDIMGALELLLEGLESSGK
jgi:type IV pilus assembly protein PilQ